MKVSIPVPTVSVEKYLVFHIKSDNSVENIIPIISDGKITFETSSFSYFIIAEEIKEHVHDYQLIEGSEPSCTQEGIVKHYHCEECGKNFDMNYGEITDLTIEKLEHDFTEWYPSNELEDQHERSCKCGLSETGNCEYDEGKITKEPSHFEEGIKTYTCKECGRTKEEPISKLEEHDFTEWYPSNEFEDQHERLCKCGVSETGNCEYDEGKITKEPSHFEEGIKTYTCKECGRTKEEPITKLEEHDFTDWYPSNEFEDKHERSCNCGVSETGNCEYDEGKITKEPTHTEEGIKTYTCKECGRIKEEPISKLEGHEFTEWYPSIELEDKHERLCKCGETETGDCEYDEGKITKEPTHTEEGIKTYTCKECGRTKEEPISKLEGHEITEWYPSNELEDKHERLCKCGETETGDCQFDEGITDSETGLIKYTCSICGREKVEVTEEESGIIIVIAGGTATFEGKETLTSDSKLYGENVNAYIAQENDVLNVSLTAQEGREFKYWVSANGTIIPDENFSMLVFRSGYYYPVFEDITDNEFSTRVKIFEGNCEEGILYMSTNSKGDIKYELEFINGGHHNFNDYEHFNNQYHKQECIVCGETLYENHFKQDSTIIKEAGHAEEGQIQYQCYCGHEWLESIPVTDEHSIDYDDWHIIEESINGQYGKYRVYCKYCDYYEEYWYLGNVDFISFMDNHMINYQYTYGGKVCHDEYYYSYRNASGEKVYIWAFQYEYETSSNADYNDTYIFMYIDDEDSTTIEPVYLSKSNGDRRSEYLWAIYGYVYDVNGWIKTLDSPDINMGCNDGMLLGNSMSARSSVFESYHNEWAETYNRLRIPTTKEYNDLSDTPWEIYFEGKSFQGGYYDENGEYVSTGGRDIISYVKDIETSYQKYMHVDKATGITYGYEDYGTYYRTTFIMRKYKEIVSPEELDNLDAAGQSLVYSYGDIEKDIKSLCSKRKAFNNFTLNVPETINAFRLLFSDPYGVVDLSSSGNYTNVYYNTAHVYNSGIPISFTWVGDDEIIFDRYEIWDFENQKWILLSEEADFIFNTSENLRRTAAYIRVVCHKEETPIEPGDTYRISIENGYFEIDGEQYYDSIEVAAGTTVYIYENNIEGMNFQYWLDENGNEFNDYYFIVSSNISLKAVYTEALYNVYCQGWNYESYVSVNGDESGYTKEFEGKKGESFELTTEPCEDSECNVFIGWFMETYGKYGSEYILLSDKETFVYQIQGNESGFIYAVWTTGENPFIKKYVDIRGNNGFVMYSGGEALSDNILDNAYSVISVSYMGRVMVFDDPTDEIIYTFWDMTYRYELEGELNHDIRESYIEEETYFPVDFWIDDPQYSYPDGVINITGIDNPYDSSEDGSEVNQVTVL